MVFWAMLVNLGGKRVIVVRNVAGFPVLAAQPAFLFTEELCRITAERETVFLTECITVHVYTE